MNKKIIVISTSLRAGSNSEQLADAFIKGCEAAGNRVEKITLRDKVLQRMFNLSENEKRTLRCAG